MSNISFKFLFTPPRLLELTWSSYLINSDSIQESYTTIEYNQIGKISKVTTYKSFPKENEKMTENNSLDSYIIFKYDTKGKLIESDFYRGGDIENGSEEYTYNAQGRIQEKRADYYYNYTYSATGLELECKVTDVNGKLLYKTNCIYQYLK